MILRTYQQRAVMKAKKALKKKGNTLLIASTGAGKTVMLAALAGEVRGKTLILQHRQELVQQNAAKFLKVNPSWPVSFFTADEKSFAGQATFAMQQTLTRNLDYLPKFDHIICDECFPSHTWISPGKFIKDIKIGDEVDAFCEETQAFYKKKVTRLFKNPAPKNLIKIVTRYCNVVCTKNHPVYTKRGWVDAQNITEGDYVYGEMLMVRGGVQADKNSTSELQKKRQNLLQERMRDGLHRPCFSHERKNVDSGLPLVPFRNYTTNQDAEAVCLHKSKCLLFSCMFQSIQGNEIESNYGRDEQKICLCPNEKKQSDAQSGNKSKFIAVTPRERTQPPHTRGERNRAYRPTSDVTESDTAITAGISSKNKHAQGGGIPDLLQDRFGVPCNDGCRRSRWPESQYDSAQSRGSEERRIFEWQRVDSVEIQERAGSERSGKLQADDFVYNFEVEDLHTYVANGIVVHNCHHIVAPTYSRIIDACRDRNPNLWLSGFTATPERSDKKSLRRYFDNVAEKITVRELVSLGFLVPPKAYVVNVGAQEQLAGIKNLSAFGDQTEVAKILDTAVINSEVVRHWKERAADRKTIVFCSTIQHALDVADAFKKAGVDTGVVTGDMADGERKAVIARFDRGPMQVLVNVAILTEGFDSQPVSCVILLRQCSDKGPMIQMAGRGLRTVDPTIYPGVVKKDCLILDFGTSLLTHGNLDQEDGLHQEVETEKGECVTKVCPEEYAPGMVYRFPDKNDAVGCGAEVPVQTKTCPICGFTFERIDGQDQVLTEVSLTELDILNASPFRWTDLFGTDTCLMACGFAAWAGVFSPDHGETWIALGKLQEEKKVYPLAVTGRLQAMSAADDFLRNYETSATAKKSRRWLDDPATAKQLEILGKFGYDVAGPVSGFTKYAAACHANFHFNKRLIERALGVV